MPSASVAADLKCQECGRLLVKDGELACPRCGAKVQATLGQKEIYCKQCHPWTLLAKNDQALCTRSNCKTDGKRTRTTMKEKEVKQMSFYYGIDGETRKLIEEFKKRFAPEVWRRFFSTAWLLNEDQMSRLDELGYPDVSGFGKLGFDLEVPFPDGFNKKAMLVIPEPVVSLSKQLSILGCKNVTNEGFRGHEDKYKVGVRLPYWIDDVEEEGIPPKESENLMPFVERMKSIGRRPLTLAEGIALLIQRPHLLREKRVFLFVGSDDGRRNVPGIAVYDSGKAQFNYYGYNNQYQEVPTCKE